MASGFPAILDNWPARSADPERLIGPDLDNDYRDSINELEIKLGYGGTVTPAANQILAGTATGRSNWTASPTLSGTLTSNSGTWGRAIQDLRGDQLGYVATGGNLTPGLWMDVRLGTGASPVTGSGGVGGIIKISKTEDLRSTDYVANTANEQSAPFVAHVKGAATSEVQACCGYWVAETASTVTGQNDDAMAIGATGRIIGSGTGYGIGGYFVGRTETATGRVNAIEARSWNNTATDMTYNPTGASTGMGIWLSCSGQDAGSDPDRLVGVGIQFGRALEAQYDVGIGFSKIGGVSSVRTTSISDDGDATTSIAINGTHTYALTTGASAGAVSIGRTTPLDADALLSVYKSVPGTPLVHFSGNAVTDLVIVQQGQGAGSQQHFSAGATNNVVTGSVQGDQGIGFSATKSFHLGRYGTRAALRVSDNLGIGPNADSFGSGAGGVVFISNATTVPTTNPTGGGILYAESGALKYRGTSGTVTTVAPA